MDPSLQDLRLTAKMEKTADFSSAAVILFGREGADILKTCAVNDALAMRDYQW